MCAIRDRAKGATPMIRDDAAGGGVVGDRHRFDRSEGTHSTSTGSGPSPGPGWPWKTPTTFASVWWTGNGVDSAPVPICRASPAKSPPPPAPATRVAGTWRDIHAAVLRNAPMTKPIICAVEGSVRAAWNWLVVRTSGLPRSPPFALPEVRHA